MLVNLFVLLAQDKPAPLAPAVREIRVQPPSASASSFDGVYSVAIDELPTLWAVEWRGGESSDGSSGCTDAAWGRLLVNIGDNRSNGRDELVVGNVESELEDAIEHLPDELVGEVVAHGGWTRVLVHDQVINSIAVLRDPTSRAVLGFAVGSGEFTGFFCDGYGRARVFPTRGEWKHPNRPKGTGFGNTFAQLVGDGGDLDGDGVPEVLVKGDGPFGIEAYSCSTGELVASSDGDVTARPFCGGVFATLGDIDGDGTPEIAVGSPCLGSGGVVLLLDRELRLRTKLAYAGDLALFGASMAVLEDLDGDGHPEVAIGAPWSGESRRGALHILSGRTFETSRAWRGERDFGTLGRSLCADHDLDGDGVRDLVVGAPGGDGHTVRGAVYVISGRDGRALLRIDGEADANGDIWSHTRSTEYFPISDAFGWAVATGDFDGDGLADLAIGSPQHESNQRIGKVWYPQRGPNLCVGKVYAISGVVLRTRFRSERDVQLQVPATPSDDLASAPSRSITDLPRMWTIERRLPPSSAIDSCFEFTSIGFGRLVTNVGDLDRDGRDTLVVGTTPDFIFQSLELVEAGVATAIGGRSAGADIVLDSEIRCVARIGDLAADGPHGFVVGLGEDTGMDCGSRGRSRVYPVDLGLVAPANPSPIRFCGDTFASAIADAGDLDRDGVHDFVVGQPGESDLVRTFSGANGRVLGSIREPRKHYSDFGRVLIAGRDLDGDGFGEIVVGEPDNPGVGSFWIYSGATRERLAHVLGSTQHAMFASALAWIDDLDGDRVPEIVVGAPLAAELRGEVYVVSGKTRSILFAWRGQFERSGFGRSLACDHDLDGDGVKDIVVGAPGAGSFGVPVSVHVFSGKSGRALLRIDGEKLRSNTAQATQAFGWAVATGDFDGDGLADVAIGAPQRGLDGRIGKLYGVSGAVMRAAMVTKK